MTKRPLILFSGGLDSTFSVYLQYKKNENFDVVYIDGGQGGQKNEIERYHRLKIMEWLREFGKSRYGEDMAVYPRELQARSCVRYGDAPAAGFRQAPAWFIAAMEVVDPVVHSEVIISYVAGDQITPFIGHLSEAWNALWNVAKTGPVVPLNFPLSVVFKKSIVDSLPIELYDITWVCERPDGSPISGYKACGYCLPCETRAVEEYRRFRDRLPPKGRPMFDKFVHEVAFNKRTSSEVNVEAMLANTEFSCNEPSVEQPNKEQVSQIDVVDTPHTELPSKLKQLIHEVSDVSNQ